MRRTPQDPEQQTTGGRRRPGPLSILAAAGIGAGIVLGGSAPAQAAEPDPEDFSEDTYGGVLIGEGAGTFPVDTEFDLMLDAEEFEIPEAVEIWALSTEGDTVLIGEGPTESDVYQNPGAADPVDQAVELLEVELPSAELPTSDWHAFVAMDPAAEELITWTVYPVELEDDPQDFTDPPKDIWPMPDHSENTEPSSEPPTLDALTEDTYGMVSILEDTAMIPVDEPFTAEVETSLVAIDLWLLPPGGEEAVFLPAALLEESADSGSPQWEISVSSDDVEYNGIYGLVATNESDGLIGWAPFGLSVDGESLQPGDPGVHESDADYSDRSIWPIPDSVPGPDEDQAEQTESPESEDGETQSPEPESTDEAADAGAEPASETDEGTNWVVIVLAIAGGGLIVAGIAYLIGNRRRAS